MISSIYGHVVRLGLEEAREGPGRDTVSPGNIYICDSYVMYNAPQIIMVHAAGMQIMFS